VLEVVFFVVDVAADAVSDTAIGSDGEGGEFFVDGLGGLVELLGGGRKDKEGITTEGTEEESTEGTEKRRKERVDEKRDAG
jgi:hypothetical protein